MQRATADCAVSVIGLEKSFGEWPVLWDLDLTLDWGELLVLFGPNGSGKTTLLKILSTQVRPDSGSVSIAGFDLRRQANQVRRRVGVVGHDTFLHDDLTCLENLVFYGRLFGLKQPQSKALDSLKQVGLENREGHRVRTLSNGMQRRVSIARALLHDPWVLLLDEPEVGLDGPSVAMLGELINRWTESGRSVVMTTHNADLVDSWPGHQGHMIGGHVRFSDETEAQR
ncbi:MAG: heme ABC exporter, ATP-binding protein CcmA [SAR202 cluster bacterium Io17-Chloro-G9]|nr:MAG: heme ABC exporter, ATP-binding protein CcmA [SAR202 cluster bacterium Io17-Chloro-G9]